MGLFDCDLTSDARAVLLEGLLSKEVQLRITRSTKKILSENWSLGGMFTGVAFLLIWEEEKKTWWLSFSGRMFCRRQAVQDVIDMVVSIVDSHPGCRTHLKRKAPNQPPEPTSGLAPGRGSS